MCFKRSDGQHLSSPAEKRLCLAREKGIIVFAADRESKPGAGSHEEHMRPATPEGRSHLYE